MVKSKYTLRSIVAFARMVYALDAIVVDSTGVLVGELVDQPSSHLVR